MASCSIGPVKNLRVWLLLLLLALLPVRGAMAAAMLCSAGGSGLQGEPPIAAPGHEAIEHGHGHAIPDLVHDHAHDHAHAGDGARHATADHCEMCSAFCSITPLVSELPALPGPRMLATLAFPDLSAPAPSFFSDGQERPPRSC